MSVDCRTDLLVQRRKGASNAQASPPPDPSLALVVWACRGSDSIRGGVRRGDRRGGGDRGFRACRVGQGGIPRSVGQGGIAGSAAGDGSW